MRRWPTPTSTSTSTSTSTPIDPIMMAWRAAAHSSAASTFVASAVAAAVLALRIPPATAVGAVGVAGVVRCSAAAAAAVASPYRSAPSHGRRHLALALAGGGHRRHRNSPLGRYSSSGFVSPGTTMLSPIPRTVVVPRCKSTPPPPVPVAAAMSSSSYHSITTTRLLSSSYSPCSSSLTENEVRMRRDARSIIDSAISAVDPRAAVRSHLLPSLGPGPSDSSLLLVTTASGGRRNKPIRYEAGDYGNGVIVVAFGKASVAMAAEACEAVTRAFSPPNDEDDGGVECGGVVRGGLVITKDGHATEEEVSTLLDGYNVTVRYASHPVPDDRSVSATHELLDLVRTAPDRTLVVCCVSGGGSALLCSPRPPLTLSDLARTNEILLRSGMDITEMNVVRRSLELAKGGRLASDYLYEGGADMCTLVLSDVIGDPLHLIASGPTVPVPTDGDDGEGASGVTDGYWGEVRRLVRAYGLDADRGGGADAGGDNHLLLPRAVLEVIEGGERDDLKDDELSSSLSPPPTASHPVFSVSNTNGGSRRRRSETVLVGNNRLAVNAAAQRAEDLGYNPVVLGTTVRGEARDVAGMYVALAEELVRYRSQGTGVDKGGGGRGAGEKKERYGIAALPACLIAGGETTVTMSASGVSPTSWGRGGRNQEIGLAAALELRRWGLRDVVIGSVGTDGTDGPTDAAGAVVDGNSVDRIEGCGGGGGGGMSGEEALRRHDSYTFFDGEGGAGGAAAAGGDVGGTCLVRTGPTGTNVADVAVVLVR